MRHRSPHGLRVAQQLRALLGEDNLPATLTLLSGLQLCARRCSRLTYDCDGKRVSYLSGGLVLEVATPTPAHSGRRCCFRRSLGAGWTDDQFINAVDTMLGKALAAKELNDLRDQLYREVGELEEPLARLVDEEAELSGRSSCYSEMSAEDVRAWRRWLLEKREEA